MYLNEKIRWPWKTRLEIWNWITWSKFVFSSLYFSHNNTPSPGLFHICFNINCSSQKLWSTLVELGNFSQLNSKTLHLLRCKLISLRSWILYIIEALNFYQGQKNSKKSDKKKVFEAVHYFIKADITWENLFYLIELLIL